MFDVYWVNALLMGIVGFMCGYWQSNRTWTSRIYRMTMAGSMPGVKVKILNDPKSDTKLD